MMPESTIPWISTVSRMPNQECKFKCRRCRVYLFGGDNLLRETDDDNPQPDISVHNMSYVWYLTEETHPEWIQAAIHQAQWTKGKLNCPKCQGRLGSFDFISPNKTQISAGVFSSIQISKNRVDMETRNPSIDRIQKVNRTAIHVKEQSASNLTSNVSTEHDDLIKGQPSHVISSYAEATAAIAVTDKNEGKLGNNLDGAEDVCATGTAKLRQSTDNHGNNLAESLSCDDDNVSDILTDENLTVDGSGDHNQSCVGASEQSSGIRRRLVQSSTYNVQSGSGEAVHQCQNTVDNVLGTSGHLVNSSEPLETVNTQTIVDRTVDQQHEGSLGVNDSSQNDNDNISVETLAENAQFIGTSFDGENSASWEDFFEEILDEMEESRFTSSQAEIVSQLVDEDQVSHHAPGSEGHNVSPRHVRARERAALRRERNRRKKERRKQRRKAKWIESQNADIEDQEPANLTGLLDILGTDWSREALKEVTTCSICLDVFYQPHSCVPCNHIFCEPCLRQLATVHHVVAPCPLCRTSIQTVVEHYELTAAIKKLFPGQVERRREAERRTLHRSFPLPGHSPSMPITRPWFTIPRFRTSDTNDQVRQFTSRVNRVRQRRQELNRTHVQEISGEMLAVIMFFAVAVGVAVAFLTLMQEFA